MTRIEWTENMRLTRRSAGVDPGAVERMEGLIRGRAGRRSVISWNVAVEWRGGQGAAVGEGRNAVVAESRGAPWAMPWGRSGAEVVEGRGPQ